MWKNTFSLLCCLDFIQLVSFGQISIKGVIINDSNIPVNAATVQVLRMQSGIKRLVAKLDGSFVVRELEAGKAYTLWISAVAYRQQEIKLELQKDTALSSFYNPSVSD